MWLAVVSQPCDIHCNVPQPGHTDSELGEFWVGSPFEIFRNHNLSSFERNRLFLNTGSRNFVDVSYVSATNNDGDSRDGQMDLAVRQSGGPPLLIYENRLPKQNFLKLTLIGSKSNRLGIGARVTATVGDRQIVRECYPVNSYLSKGPLMVRLGLGSDTKVDKLVVS